jgi:antitoxin (DNA-binding transcriptional repressor) of toxin-antitoxin stability system
MRPPTVSRMTRVNAQSLQSRLPELLDRVKHGEEVAIIERGKPVAKLVVHPQRRRNYRSIVGCWHGRVDLSGADAADKAIYRKLGMLG